MHISHIFTAEIFNGSFCYYRRGATYLADIETRCHIANKTSEREALNYRFSSWQNLKGNYGVCDYIMVIESGVDFLEHKTVLYSARLNL